MKILKIALPGLLLLFSGAARASEPPFGPLTLSFEENRGQVQSDAKFLARGHGYNLLLTPEGNRLLLRHGGSGLALTTRLDGSNAKPVIRGERKQAGKVHYLRGNQSLTNIPTYSRVRYQAVYPGIDLVYYGNESQLEYDFVVTPGAHPDSIAMTFNGADGITLDTGGNLVLRAGNSEIIQHKPIVYQDLAGQRRKIDAGYRIRSANTVGFEIGSYDRTAVLIIDPILSYSTFLGGSSGDDDARAVATDSSGNVYLTGSTTSTNFQTVSPVQGTAGTPNPDDNLSDAFITKLNAAGSALVYSTYLGGTNDDDANAIAVDSSGNVIIAGSTASVSDFPTTAGAIRRSCNTGTGGTCLDAFVAKLNAAGTALTYSTYLGGTGDDEARGVAVDTAGNAYVTGKTTSANFATTAGAFSTDSTTGGFVTKLSPAGAVVYSSYFGAGTGTTEPRGIAVDASGSAYVTGSTPAATATGTDVFITKLNAAGTASVYSQFIRGGKDESGNAVAVDSTGNAYVAGLTSSIDFTTTPGVVQAKYGGGPAFRSADAGTNWSANSTGITRSSLYALVSAATTPMTLYAGADDELAGGVFKSTDGGSNWTNLSTGLSDARVHALAVDPATPATIYAGTRSGGVFKTTNGGATWSATTLNAGTGASIVIDPVTPTTVYAGMDGGGVYKSTNGGTSWAPINNGLASLGVHSLVIHPATPSTLYAGTGAGIYKTTNGGGTWIDVSSGLFDSNINALVLDPRNPSFLLAATTFAGVFRSVNGGAFWFSSNAGLTAGLADATFASALTLDTASGTFYAAAGESNVSRIYRSSNGITWTATGLSTAKATALLVDRANSNAVYAATLGGSDAFAAKWNASGTLVYATYLGGYRDDSAQAIAIDPAGNAYVAGSTSSTNFPTAAAMQSTFGGGSGAVTDAFVAKLNASGAALTYSSYIGGGSNDFGKGITVDLNGDAIVVGQTGSSDFPTSAPLTATRPGLLDVFVTKVSETSTIAYSVFPRGGVARVSDGGSTTIVAGYARITPSGTAAPSGLAIFSFRQGGTLLSEAAVPAAAPMTSGRLYAEVSATVNTGVAVANPNNQAVTLNFYFTDASGTNFGSGTTTIAANGQIAKFLTDAPFNSGASVNGTFTFTASSPVAVIALRGLTNERAEFLMTTLPVSNLSAAVSSNVLLFPHFADGGGWTTQIVMVNTGDAAMAGSIQFSDNVTIAGQTGMLFTYSIPGRSSRAFRTSGTTSTIQSGSVTMTPTAGNSTPSGIGVFSFKSAGITVTEAGVPASPARTAFRLYAESSGNFSGAQTGSAQTGIAIANASAVPVTVNFELNTLAGASTGLSGVEVVPANGHLAKFLGQITGFANLESPFQGVLRVSTASSSGITVVGLRGRYNERNDFLITTTPPSDESAAAPAAEQYFPHLADGGGYTTQFILFNGSTDQSSAGSFRFFAQSGQPLSLSVR